RAGRWPEPRSGPVGRTRSAESPGSELAGAVVETVRVALAESVAVSRTDRVPEMARVIGVETPSVPSIFPASVKPVVVSLPPRSVIWARIITGRVPISVAIAVVIRVAIRRVRISPPPTPRMRKHPVPWDHHYSRAAPLGLGRRP